MSDFEHDDRLPALPAVRQNLTDLFNALTDDRTGILSREQCSLIDSPETPATFMSRLRKASSQAEDLLLVYYAGHGVRHDKRDGLYLTVHQTDPDGLDGTAVPFEWVRDAIEHSPARTRLLLLDCCYSGMAIGSMAGTAVDPREVAISGTSVITSSPRNKVSHSPPGERHTAFSGALISLLAHGARTPGEALTVSLLYRGLVAAMANRELPQPKFQANDSSGDLLLRREPEPGDDRRDGPVLPLPTGPEPTGPEPTPTEARRPPSRRLVDRHRIALAVAVTALVVLTAATAVLLWLDKTGTRTGDDKRVATIAVGTRPESVAVSASGDRLYVTNSGSGSVSVADPVGTVVTTVPVGAEPGGVAVSPDGRAVYVANFGSRTVSVLDTSSNTVTRTILLDSNPDRIVLGRDRAYVSGATAGVVEVVDTSTAKVSETVQVGTKPFGVLVSPEGDELYVVDAVDNTVTVVRTADNEVVATIAVGRRPQDSALSPDGSRAYVPNHDDGTLSVLDTESREVVATIGVGGSPQGVVVSPDGGLVYVVSEAEGRLTVVDAGTDRVARSMPVGETPLDIALSPDGRRAYIPLAGERSVAVVRLDQIS